MDARFQLFDFKTKYSFQTSPGVDQYNMPLYDVQVEGVAPGTQSINYYPVYQGFLGPAYVNGVQVSFQTQKQSFFNAWPNIVQYSQILGQGNGTSGPYNFQIPFLSNFSAPNPPNPPFQGILRGHVDISGIIATGINQDPPLVTDSQIIANLPFIQNIPVTSVNSAVYITSSDNTGANVIVQDSGQFLASNVNIGLLMQPGHAPLGNKPLFNGYEVTFVITGSTNATQAILTATTSLSAGQVVQISGVVGMTQLNGRTFTVVSATPTTVTINVDSTGFGLYISGGTISSIQNVINYFSGIVTNLYFPQAIPAGQNINAQCYFFQTGLPRGILFNNNVITLRSPPDRQYLVELDAYLSPAAFLNSAAALPFGYMAEYIARGAARKILSDTGDIEQFQFYEPFFREQELLVWKRSQRQWTATRTETIYSQGRGQGNGMGTNYGGGF